MPEQIQLYPSRLVASGTQTLAADSVMIFEGRLNGQSRRQFIVTNLHAALPLKLCVPDSFQTPFATVQALTSFTVETSADICVLNPAAAATVDFEVGEVFYDEGAPGSQTGSNPATRSTSIGVGPRGNRTSRTIRP